MADSPLATDSTDPTQPRHALVFCGDSNPLFAASLAVAIRSALTHLPADSRPTVYVIDCGLPADAVPRLIQVAHRVRPDVEVKIVEFDLGRVANLPDPEFFPMVVYARLFVDELVDESVQRIVFVDADMLVLRDLSPLFTHDFANAPFAAVRDVHQATVPGDASRPYFNAGFLAIDVPRWREQRVTEKCLAYATSAEQLKHAEQDALNAVCPDWYLLDLSWNLQLGGLIKDTVWEMSEGWMSRDELAAQYRSLRSRDVIFHFTGRKPWYPSHGPLPGSWRWAVSFARSGWLSSPRAWFWFANWNWKWARYSAGTARRQWTNRN